MFYPSGSPIGDESRLEVFYSDLVKHEIFINHFGSFTKYKTIDPDIAIILEMQNGFAWFINSRPKEANDLKTKINSFFKILNLIEYVIELDLKYSQPIFLEFWRRFNNEFNNLNKPVEIIDDVEIYFDNKIGIVAPAEVKEKDKSKPGVKGGSNGSDDNKYKYDILKVIEKRNQEEEAIEELIKEFEAKIDLLFEYVHTDDSGKRLIAKMQADGLAFDSDEIYNDFAKIYRKFIRRHKDLSEFFLKESSDIVNQICDDFERTLKTSYADMEIVRMAADKGAQYNCCETSTEAKE